MSKQVHTPTPITELLGKGWTMDQLTPERLASIAHALRRQAEKYRAKAQYTKAAQCLAKAASYE